jgi:hypothetical protein
MSKSVSIDQSHSVIQTLANNVDWSVLDGDVLQEQVIKNPKEAGKQFTAFLKNGGKVIVDSPRVIKIERSMPFDPKVLLGKGWRIEEQDERALALTTINLTEVILDSILEKGEKIIKGEDRFRRIKEKTNRIRLDAGIFKTLWENQILIPEKWKEETNGESTSIYFEGTIFRNSNGNRCVLNLCGSGGEWRWSYCWNGYILNASDLSAVLEVV